MNTDFQYNAADEQGTQTLAAALATALLKKQIASAIIGLVGPLGAGKTRFVQAVADAACVPRGMVASPTFVLVNEYQGQVPIFHFDTYRLGDESEFMALGADEYFSQPGWSFIEWADRVRNSLPPDRLEIVIQPTGTTSRQFVIRAMGPQHQRLLDQLKQTPTLPAKADGQP
jgi:tRNA threonylcarbamoyladenosine biosynthesis protein TsaE